MRIKLTVHEQDIVALGLGRLDVRVLGIGIGGVKVDDLLVLVGLLVGDSLAVILE